MGTEKNVLIKKIEEMKRDPEFIEMILKDILAQKIKQTIKEKGIEIETLEKEGFTRKTISRILSGDASIRTMIRFLVILGYGERLIEIFDNL